MSHIVLVIHALHGGGAERVAATMANMWVQQGRQVTVITLGTVPSDVYEVRPEVHRIGLDWMRESRHLPQALWNNRQRMRALRQAIRQCQPDCVVSLTDQMNILTLLATRPLRLPVVVAEHSDPRCQNLGTVREWLRRRTYRRASAIVVLTESVAQHMRGLAGPAPVHVIPNGIAAPEGAAPLAQRAHEQLIVAMGRLSEEKGFDLLLEAFAQVARGHSPWRLEIAGAGRLREPLEQQIGRHHLADRARLVGWVEPDRFLQRAAIFVLSSRYEGFPVALLEAMAQGLAVISFDCDSGPREILRHEQDGLLVPAGDVGQLAQAIDRVIGDQALRERLSAAAMKVAERFSPERFAADWDKVLRSAAGV